MHKTESAWWSWHCFAQEMRHETCDMHVHMLCQHYSCRWLLVALACIVLMSCWSQMCTTLYRQEGAKGGLGCRNWQN